MEEDLDIERTPRQGIRTTILKKTWSMSWCVEVEQLENMAASQRSILFIMQDII